jgi:hypothetical protein
MKEILDARSNNLARSEIELCQWLVDQLQVQQSKGSINYMIHGEVACRTAFMFFHGISKHKLGRAIAMMKKGNSICVHHNVVIGRLKPQYEFTRAFLSTHFKTHCDPNSIF